MTRTPDAKRDPVELVVLGSGTALPTAARGSPGYLLRFASGGAVLLDAGPGSVRAAARAGHGVQDLAGVLLTHFHLDHCLDVFALLFALRNPALEGRAVTLAGPTGLAALLAGIEGVFGSWVRLPSSRLTVVELEPGPFAVDFGAGVVRGHALRMPHLGHSLGYRIQGSRSVLAYSGDTGRGEAPIELGRGTDYYLLEAALPDGSDTSTHLTPASAGEVAREAGCRHLLITHLYPETERGPVLETVTRAFGGPVTLVADQTCLAL